MHRDVTNAVLALSSIAFLALALVQTRAALADPAAPAHAFPLAFHTALAALALVAAAGAADSLLLITALLAPPSAPSEGGAVAEPGSAEGYLRPAWRRPAAYLVYFWALELLWEILLLSGAATAWSLPSAAGRARLVYPLRYVGWAATNAYILTALAAALRAPEAEAMTACLAITLLSYAALPLELLPVASLGWAVAAVLALCALALVVGLVARRAAALLPYAARGEGLALRILAAITLATYLAFPLTFFSARLCGGEGAGTCLAPADEAWYWRTLESFAKAAASALIVGAVRLTEPLFDRQARAGLPARRVLTRPLPEQFQAAPAASAASIWAALRGALPYLLCAPALVGAVCYLALETLQTLAAAGQGGGGSGGAGASLPDPRYVSLAVAGAVLVLGLDAVVRAEKMRAFTASYMPRGLFESASGGSGSGHIGADTGGAITPLDYNSALMYYVEEPHATLLFADLVDFTPNSLAVAPVELMERLAILFRHYDQLHAAAGGVAKVETGRGMRWRRRQGSARGAQMR